MGTETLRVSRRCCMACQISRPVGQDGCPFCSKATPLTAELMGWLKFVFIGSLVVRFGFYGVDRRERKTGKRGSRTKKGNRVRLIA